ncbi:MAG: DUF4394 domain-containing protein [Planctomycetota bacterium]
MIDPMLRTFSAVLLALGILHTNAFAETIFGVTENQFLVSFDSSSPNNILSGTAFSGLQPNETILGIDFRPATDVLFALGSSSRLYEVDTTTGQVFQVGPGAFTPTVDGSSFGFDFNPTIDRIRLDSETNANYVLNPNTGSATVVTDLFYGAGDPNEGTDPNVVHAAYTNSFAGATTTQLYAIDTGLDILVTQANSAGTLGTVGALPVDVNSVGGFDISGTTGTAFMAVQAVNESRTQLWTVDLGTGGASLVGEINGGSVLTAIAVAGDRVARPDRAIPEPSTATIAVVGIAAVCTRRLRGRS